MTADPIIVRATKQILARVPTPQVTAFFHEPTFTASYVVADRGGKRAAIIDSVLDFDEKAGRDHNQWGFTMLMAGGGVKGGQAIGATDELGLKAIEEPHHIHDLHASILYLLGLDHLKTTYMRLGRAERPTVAGGHLITKLWT